MATRKRDDEVIGKAFDAHLTKRALQFMKPYGGHFVFALIMLILVSMANIAKPYLLKIAIDSGVKGRSATVLTITAISYLVVYLLRWLFSYLQSIALTSLSQYVTNDIRHTLFRHIQSLSLDFFNKREVGRIISRLMGDVSSLDALIVSGAIGLLTNIFTALGVVFVMAQMNWRLTLMTFTLLPVIVVITIFFRQIVRAVYRDVRAKVATVTATVAENVSGVRVVKSYARERTTLQRFRRASQRSLSSVMRSVIVGSVFSSSLEITTVIGVSIVFWYGGLQVANGQLTVGGFVAFLFYVNLFYGPITAMGNFYAVLQAAMAGAERIFEILDTPPEVAEKPDAIVLPPIKGDVQFNHVAFGYDEKLVLKDIDFKAEAGQTIAFVGPTGAGKTTVIGLIARQYDVRAGSITVDGIDLRDVTLKSLRSQMGVVLQESFLFPGNVRENIRYGRLDATNEEVEEAAKAVGAHDFIVTMAKNYDTEINEGGWGLSTGQKQILSFARALLADPRILILDEATSSVDTQTEQQIQAALNALLQGRTAFVIAHRLSTITEADKIILLQHGFIAESGTHQELLESGGLYRKLFDAQFEGWA